PGSLVSSTGSVSTFAGSMFGLWASWPGMSSLRRGLGPTPLRCGEAADVAVRAQQPQSLVAVAVGLSAALRGDAPRWTADAAAGGGLAGQPQPTGGVHAAPSVDHPGHVGTVPDGLGAVLAEDPVLLLRGHRLEDGPRAGGDVAGDGLTARDVHTVAARVPLEPLAPSVPPPGEDDAAGAGCADHHPHIAGRLTPRGQRHLVGDPAGVR